MGYVSEYQKKWHNSNPNSTDVHSVKHVDRLAQYLSKYISKHREFVCIGELRSYKGEVSEVLYGSEQYRQEDRGQKKGKVIGHVLGGRVRRITGRLWFCSRSLSKLKGIKINEEQFDFTEVQQLVQSAELREVRCDHAVLYFGDVVKAAAEKSKAIQQLFKAVN